ncbi:OmpA family protein [Alteromonas aestuariivivens]|uniref:OmpA family protein n=1 Tax=Alteromonas aestuariivivens TaxID=1938339 RepID=A0A3D8M7B1_9ALTE|nr:OmpA family protein [Alteromonas aestuariivivens]RDV25615.1 OmpA family protein [Alteromonas aestuariivivens]
MNKKFKLAALSLAIMSAQSFAQTTEGPAYTSWFGGFGMLYNTDGEKVSDEGDYDNGTGFGVEYGYRFSPSWAIRAEVAGLDIDYNPANSTSDDDAGVMYGADLVYFLPNDVLYLFAGIRQLDMDDSYTQASLGIGKHWPAGDRLKFITEVAAYQDFDDSYNDYSFKVGIAYTFGNVDRSSDSDGDGVGDYKDQCPMTPAGVSVDAVGCNNDLDGDGVMNGVDQCPNTPYGTPVDSRGCALPDADGDGVVDVQDMCPDTPMGHVVDERGCTVFDEEEVSITVRVLFDNESSVVKHPDDPEIAEFAGFMKSYPDTTAVIEGHTSSPGTEEYNMWLSKKRAAAFKDVLVNMYGLEASRIETVGYGETQLLDTSSTSEAHRVNRRIEVTVTEKLKVPEEK